MIRFTYANDDCEDLLVVTAEIGEWAAGSVAVKELSSRQVGIARLYVEPEWRCQHVARRLMEHVLGLYPRAEKWLYAEPYVPEQAGRAFRKGPPGQVLEAFYTSLGFEPATDAAGRRAMVWRMNEVDGASGGPV